MLDFRNIGFTIIPFDERKEDESEKVEETKPGTKLRSGRRSQRPYPHLKIVEETVSPYPRAICAHALT